MRWLWLAALVACGRSSAEPPPRAVRAIADGAPPWCVTRGEVIAEAGRAAVADPVFRAVVATTDGERASLDFTYRGPTARTVALGSGQIRHQLGLKLRAEDGCNLLYVMWRFAPRAELVVSVKRNPGQHTHAACGTRGYRDVASVPVTAPAVGASHQLAAAIVDHVLTVTIDGAAVWAGPLPETARDLRGLAGLRSDNVAFTAQLDAPAGVRPLGACEPGGDG